VIGVTIRLTTQEKEMTSEEFADLVADRVLNKPSPPVTYSNDELIKVKIINSPNYDDSRWWITSPSAYSSQYPQYDSAKDNKYSGLPGTFALHYTPEQMSKALTPKEWAELNEEETDGEV